MLNFRLLKGINMGQAKQRGTFEMRKQQSLERQAKVKQELEAMPKGVVKDSLESYGKKHGIRRLSLVMTMAQMIKS